MRLTDHERAMLDGSHGAAKARAMDLLLRYGQALGAERLVETNNVAGAFNASTPSVRALAARGFDAVYSELNLDSNDVVEVPRMAVNTCQLITGIDNAKWRIQGIPDDLAEQQKRGEAFFGRRGTTCTRPARPIKSATCQCSASIAPGWNPPPWSIAIQCSALAPTPKARRAPALRP
jgi:predicted aconitase